MRKAWRKIEGVPKPDWMSWDLFYQLSPASLVKIDEQGTIEIEDDAGGGYCQHRMESEHGLCPACDFGVLAWTLGCA